MSNGYGVIKKNNHSVRQKTLRRLGVAAAVAACFGMGFAQANPTNPVVANGAAQFTTAGNLLTVINTPNAIINWGSFSIGANEITRFMQQSSASAVLNRVGAGRDPSSILGALQSNGRVFLINPNGITFGAGSQINVAGLVASTLNLSDADFLAGRMRFTDGLGNSLINNGNITTGTGGSVYLVGNAVTNNGIITSPKGEVVLAAGSSVELVNPGTPDLRVEIVAPDNQAVNLGQIVADSGRVGIYAGLINHAGTINANSVGVDAAGNITLQATKNIDLAAGSVITANGPSGGSVTVQSGDTTLAAGEIQAKGSAGQGGSINLLGNLVGLTGNASIDASGETGGGTVLIGGDFQGKNAGVQNAYRTYVGPDATIKADAITSGNGGKVIVWADDTTRYFGAISARGGAQSGNGGFVEVSGKRSLGFYGGVDTKAVYGSSGTLLLDPDDITVVVSTSIPGNALDGTWATAEDAGAQSIGADAIAALLATGNLTLQAANTVNVNSAITSGSANMLTLTGATTINADIGLGGALAVNGNLAFSGSRTISATSLNVSGTMSISSGVTTLNANTSSTFFNMSGGVLTGNGNFSFGSGGSGGVSWSGGTIGGTGTLTTAGDNAPNINTGPVVLQRAWNPTNGFNISGTGALNIDGATVTLGAGQTADITSTVAQPIFGTGTLINNGTITTDQLNLRIASAGFSNGLGALVNIPVGTTVTISGGGTDLGTYDFIGTGAGTVVFSGGTRSFTGGGITGITPGTLTVSGGSVTMAATTALSGISTLNVTGGALTVDSTAARSFGSASFSGGTTTFNGSAIGFNGPWNVSGGTLTGSSNFNTVISTSNLSWTGGTIAGSGTMTTVAGMAGLTVSGPVVLGRSWINNHTATLSGTGSLQIDAPATLTNNGTFNITTSATAPITGGGTFLNTGTLSETVANNVSIQSVFNNQGIFTIGGGGVTTLGAATANDTATYQLSTGNTLAFNGNRTFASGGVNNTSAGDVQFLTGTVTFSGTSVYNPGGTTTVSGGTATFNIVPTLSGFTQTSGTTNFNVSANAGSGYTLQGGTINVAAGQTLTVGGTGLNWQGGSLGTTGTYSLSSLLLPTTGTLSGPTVNTANLNVQAGKSLTVAGGALNASGVTNIDGLLATAGGAFNATGAVNVGGTLQGSATGPINAAGQIMTVPGTLSLNGGSVTASNVNVSGLLKGIGTVNGNVSNSGTVAPGASPGTLNIVGNYTQASSGTLQIELGGTAAGSGFDNLTVSGNAALAGTLVITQFGSFVATPADTFNIITTGGTVSGAFSSVVVPTVFAGLGASFQSQLVQLGGVLGPVSSSIVAVDPRIVSEDKDIFAQAGDDEDIFSKLKDYLTCN